MRFAVVSVLTAVVLSPSCTSADCPDGVARDEDGKCADPDLEMDQDGDGFLPSEGDCDDADPAVHPNASETCNGVDDDCDGVVDDPPYSGDYETWYPDADNDGFGDPARPQDACAQPAGYVADASDCDDTNAAVNPLGTERFNAVDDNCDGLFDCVDPTCTDPECVNAVDVERCWNYADDDGDGLVDCEDPDCDEHVWCTGVGRNTCTNGVDDNGVDGVDEADPQCRQVDFEEVGVPPVLCTAAALLDCSAPVCGVVCIERCYDGIDNDNDGAVDCNDTACTGLLGCGVYADLNYEGDCADGLDRDGDGLVDCADDDCDGQCTEVCDDGRDNDGDSLVDCEDADCLGDPSCSEQCDDQLDNDGDGLIDCWDDDCFGPACSGALRAYVTGGRFTRHHRERQRSPQSAFYILKYASPWDSASTWRAEAVTGVVEVQGANGHVARTCAWGIVAAGGGRRVDYGVTYFGLSPLYFNNSVVAPLTRSGTWTEPGCPVQPASFLPEPVVRRRGVCGFVDETVVRVNPGPIFYRWETVSRHAAAVPWYVPGPARDGFGWQFTDDDQESYFGTYGQIWPIHMRQSESEYWADLAVGAPWYTPAL